MLRSLLWHLDRIVDYVDRGATPDEAAARALDAFAADWKERCGEIDELVDVLGNLGDLLKNTRWDLLRGLLKSSGWQQVVRIRQADRAPPGARAPRSPAGPGSPDRGRRTSRTSSRSG